MRNFLLEIISFYREYFQTFSYVIIYEKGYQETDKAIFSTTTKIKGTTSVNLGGFNSTLFNGLTIYDPEDYTIPPQVNLKEIFSEYRLTVLVIDKIFFTNKEKGRNKEKKKETRKKGRERAGIFSIKYFQNNWNSLEKNNRSSPLFTDCLFQLTAHRIA